MKKILLLTASFNLLMLTSCQLGSDKVTPIPTPPDPEPGKQIVANFGSQIQGTKVNETTFDVGDEVGIYMLNAGKALGTADAIVGTYANKHYVTNDNTGKFVPADDKHVIYFPLDLSQKTDFVAYYPYESGAEANNKISISIADQTSANKDLNIMFSNDARDKDKTDPDVDMTFKRQTVKVDFTIKPGLGVTEADLAGMSVVINEVYSQADFSFIDQTMSNYAGKTNLSVKMEANGLKGYAILLPYGQNSGVTFVFTRTNGKEHTYPVPNDHDFVSGKKYNYTITVSQNEVTGAATIQPWEPGDDRTGEAEQQ